MSVEQNRVSPKQGGVLQDVRSFDVNGHDYPLGLECGVSKLLMSNELRLLFRDGDLRTPIRTQWNYDPVDFYHAKVDLLQDYTRCGSRRAKMTENGLASTESQCQVSQYFLLRC